MSGRRPRDQDRTESEAGTSSGEREPAMENTLSPASEPPSSERSTALPADAPTESIAGERGTSTLFRAPSLQARIGNVLAVALMSLLGLGLLGWYYARTMSRPADARHAARAAVQTKAEGDLPLPALGPIEPPADQRFWGPAPEEPPLEGTPEAWLRPAEEPRPAVGPAAPATKTPQELALERRLSGPVSVGRPGSAADGSLYIRSEGASGPYGVGGVSGGGPGPAGAGASGQTALGARLQPTVTPAAQARVLPTQQLLLPKGAFIDCTLETALNSALPGMTTCITATDTFSADGQVVLLERGTKLVGESVGTVQRGAARVFVLWSEARTPTGVVIPLASPGTDELGRAGLAGRVNRHFFERFGAAILITVVDGAVQSAVAAQRDGGSTVIYNPSASQDILTEVLRSTVDIPPTVDKHHGDRIQVLVARDLDFRPVYELRAAH